MRADLYVPGDLCAMNGYAAVSDSPDGTGVLKRTEEDSVALVIASGGRSPRGESLWLCLVQARHHRTLDFGWAKADDMCLLQEGA